MISLVRKGYEISDFSERNDKTEVWACNTCRSSFYAIYTPLQLIPGKWHDMILLSTHYLTCIEIGAVPELKVPLCLDTLPKYDVSELTRKVKKAEFLTYMQQLK